MWPDDLPQVVDAVRDGIAATKIPNVRERVAIRQEGTIDQRGIR